MNKISARFFFIFLGASLIVFLMVASASPAGQAPQKKHENSKTVSKPGENFHTEYMNAKMDLH